MRKHRDRYLKRDRTFATLYADPKARMATADDLIAVMDEDGVDVAVAMGIGWSDYDTAREANDYIIEAAERSQGRIIGFAGINPAWGDRQRGKPSAAPTQDCAASASFTPIRRASTSRTGIRWRT